ncbi:hypothetical protein ABPH35_07045 [Streptococcus sp. ZJ93]|uniref:hypothetical protein n=1 Tax=Streptococcus handemini TaxID=3161188 RepID=UPI0032EFF54D
MNNLRQIVCMLLAGLVMMQPLVAHADQAYQEAVAVHEPVSLDTVKAKIKSKETFILYIGREDNQLSQQFAPKLKQAARASQKNVYYLNTAGIDVKVYKSFARKYQIKTPSYLGTFGGRKLLSYLTEIGKADEDQILHYLIGNE